MLCCLAWVVLHPTQGMPWWYWLHQRAEIKNIYWIYHGAIGPFKHFQKCSIVNPVCSWWRGRVKQELDILYSTNPGRGVSHCLRPARLHSKNILGFFPLSSFLSSSCSSSPGYIYIYTSMIVRPYKYIQLYEEHQKSTWFNLFRVHKRPWVLSRMGEFAANIYSKPWATLFSSA